MFSNQTCLSSGDSAENIYAPFGNMILIIRKKEIALEVSEEVLSQSPPSPQSCHQLRTYPLPPILPPPMQPE